MTDMTEEEIIRRYEAFAPKKFLRAFYKWDRLYNEEKIKHIEYSAKSCDCTIEELLIHREAGEKWDENVKSWKE